jgi:hypothetical protein
VGAVREVGLKANTTHNLPHPQGFLVVAFNIEYEIFDLEAFLYFIPNTAWSIEDFSN